MKFNPAGSYEFSDFRFEADSFRLFKNETAVQIPHKAALLHLFLQSPGAVLKKEEIYRALWGTEVVEESNLTRNVYLLRKTLGQSDSAEQLIETLPKIGYRFCGEVRANAPSIESVSASTIPTNEENITELPAETSPLTEISVETQILPDNPPPASDISSETFRETLSRRAKNEPLPQAAAHAWKSRRLKIAAVTCLFVVIVFSAILFSARPSKSSDVKINSIAVLPFAELGIDNRESMQGLGIADTVISRLGSFENIEVRPTAAVRRYLETPVDPLDAGRALKVEAVLTGNIQRNNADVRVTTQLVRVSDGRILWSESFDAPGSEILRLQDNLSDKLMAKLSLPLGDEKRERINKHGTESIAAYNHYLKGRLFWNRRAPEWIKKAIAEFEEAVKIDPNYAQAYAGIADSYALTASGLPPAERMPKARAAAEKALELDSGLAEAHASLGFIKYKFYLDWRGAEESLKYSIRLNPNYATAHHWLGELLACVGRFDEALAETELAEQLDPLSLPIKKDVGMVYYTAKKFDQAEAKIKETLAIDPNFVGAHHSLVLVYQEQKRYAEAAAANLLTERLGNSPEARLAVLTETLETGGWQTYWRKKLELGLPPGDDAFAYALVYLRLGDRQNALDQLEKSFDERSSIIFRVKTDPALDSLRAEPRFQQLIRRADYDN